MKESRILMNKLIYSRLLIPKLKKTLMYEFSYDNVKPKYGK